MKEPASFVMAGGGTGGHVIPALAVARELRARGHTVRFIGTHRGIESKLVPAADFPIDWIEIGGLNRVGISKDDDIARGTAVERDGRGAFARSGGAGRCLLDGRIS